MTASTASAQAFRRSRLIRLAAQASNEFVETHARWRGLRGTKRCSENDVYAAMAKREKAHNAAFAAGATEDDIYGAAIDLAA